MIDVIIPAHKKDIDTLDLCIESIRTNVKGVRRIIVVSKERLSQNAEFFPESEFPFSLDDVGNIVGFHRKTCKYYGGTLQMTAPLVIPNLERDVLTCDSDTIFLKPVEFVDENDNGLYNVSYDIASDVTSHPYIEHCEKLIPGLTKETEYSGICHHTLIQTDVLQEIFDRVQEIHGEPFWKANLMVTLAPYKSLTHPLQTRDGSPFHAECPLLITTYEFYFNYVMKYHSDRCKIRKLKQILAYKGRMGVEGESLHSVGSRTNLDGNVDIIPTAEEQTFNFASFKDACLHISGRCAQLGWDMVTFQNHTRIGAKEDRRILEEEICGRHNNTKD